MIMAVRFSQNDVNFVMKIMKIKFVFIFLIKRKMCASTFNF